MKFRLLVGVLSLPCLAVAETDTANQMAPITTTASMVPARATDPEWSVAPVHTIHRDSFNAHQQTLADVVGQIPGIQVQQRGEAGSFSTISVRGAPGRQTLVLVDGIQVPMSSGGAIDLSRFNLSDIETIEVYRSGLPPQIAQGSMGGAINIITRQPDSDHTRGRIAVTQGSFGNQLLETSLAGARGPWQWRATTYSRFARNDFPFEFDGGTPQNPGNATTERRNNAEYEARGASIAARRSWGRRHQLRWRVSVDDDRKQLPVWNNLETADSYYDRQVWRTEGEWSTNDVFATGINSTSRVFYEDQCGQLKDTGLNFGLTASDTRDHTQMAGLGQTLARGWQDHIVTLATEVRHEEFELEDRLGATSYSFGRTTLATSLSDEWTPWNDTLTLLGQVRLDMIEDNATETDGPESYPGVQAGVLWDSTPNLRLRANLNRQYRVPSLFERYGNQGNFRGNSDLVAERATSGDVSLALTGINTSAELGYFLRFSEQAIAPVYNSQGVGRNANIGDAWFQGVEGQIERRLPLPTAPNDLGELIFSAQGTLQQSVLQSNFAAYDGNQVPGYYPTSYTLEAAWARRQTSIELQWTHDSGLYYDRANSTQAPDKERLNLSVQQAFGPVIDAFEHQFEFSVQNMLDSIARDFNRDPMPGRSFFLKYQLTF